MALTMRDATLPAAHSHAPGTLPLGPPWTALLGDTSVAPPWHWLSHVNPGARPAYLFEFDDQPALRALGLFQQETAP